MSAFPFRFLTFLSSAVLALAIQTAGQGGEGPFRALAFDAACAAAKGESKVVMIDFFTTWCGPCKKLDAVTWRDEAVVRWLAERTVPLKIDAEKELELAKRFRVDAYPSLVFVQPDGKELGRLLGFKDARTFLAAANDLLAGLHLSDRFKKQFEDKGWNDPMLRKEYAQELALERRHEEALEHFLWCFDHGDENPLSGFGGVRLSFLLSDIAKLGKKHPLALVELRKRRDAAQALLLAGTADSRQEAEFSAINRVLGEGRLTLELYDKLATVEPQPVDGRRPDPRATLFKEVFELLVEDRRYEEAVLGLGDPVEHFEQQLALEKARRVPRRVSLPEDVRERLAASRSRDFVEKMSFVYEALAGARHDEQVLRIQQQILEYDAAPESVKTLAEHARRAGRPEIAETLEKAAKGKDEK
jgi:thiol-disulfide isomerase/thioredoxin